MPRPMGRAREKEWIDSLSRSEFDSLVNAETRYAAAHRLSVGAVVIVGHRYKDDQRAEYGVIAHRTDRDYYTLLLLDGTENVCHGSSLRKADKMKYYDQDGIEVADAEIRNRVDASIEELERRLEEAKRFKANLLNGTVEHDQGYLDFEAVLVNGYDRTGPRFVYAEDGQSEIE